MNHDIKKKEDDEPDEEDSELEAGSSFEEELTDPGQNRMNCLHKRKANGWRKREFNYCMKLWFLKEYTACIRDRDYNYVVVCYDNVNAGTAKVHITFSNMYKGTLTTTFKIKRGKQSITTSKNSYTVNYSSVQKKDQIINLKADAKTSLSYTSSNKKYITVSKGKAKVKKGTPKGTYTVTIKAKATKNCKEKTKKVNIVVK